MTINLADVSWKDLCLLAKKCDFCLFEGGKHTKVKKPNGDFITTIPRTNRLNRETARGIVKEFKKAGCQKKDIKI